jgi:5'-3' exonuclease
MTTKTYAVIDGMGIMIPYGMYQGLDLSATVDGKTISTTMAFNFLRFVVKLVNAGDIPIICLDSWVNLRKLASDTYKANRPGLNIPDFGDQLEIIHNSLISSNFNVLREDGYEADDLMLAAAKQLTDGKVKIYSCDMDLTQGIDENVSWVRGHNQKKYEVNEITRENYGRVIGIPYNTIVLYKATVGDPADNIAGIKGFGAAAFSKLIDQMRKDEVDFSTIRCNNREEALLSTYFDGDKLAQAKTALSVVLPMETTVGLDFEMPINKNTLAWWAEKYGMNSIVKSLQ